LIFMDVQMPVMDGFEAAAEIRRLEIRSRRHVPIVAMTANALNEDRDACLAAGMDDYVSKPVSLANLRAVIEKWLPAKATV
jgi:two-component system sensor histidine kinase/response regulator